MPSGAGRQLLWAAMAVAAALAMAGCGTSAPEEDGDIDSPEGSVESDREPAEPDTEPPSEADTDSGETGPPADGDGDGSDGPEAEPDPDHDPDPEIPPGSLLLHLPPAVALGRPAGMVALHDRGADALPADVTGLVEWISGDPSILEVATSPPRLIGRQTGSVSVRAVLHGLQLAAEGSVEVRRREQVEARGIWVNRWAWSNAADIEAVIARAAGAGFNQVYFQVRGVFDACYNSAHEPWARRLTGSLGGDPGWDPLRVAIESAGRHGLELHAWINALTCWEGGTPPTESAPCHALLEHPDWVMRDADHIPMPVGSGYVWCSPGNPEVRDRVVDVAIDIVSKYRPAGIHLDRIRYPSPAYSHDPASETGYRQALSVRPGLDFADWRREQVTALVASVRTAVRWIAPLTVVSAAVGGIYRDTFGWGGVTEAYDDWLQDWEAWDREGAVDALVPMVYWPKTDGYGGWTDFRTLVDSHANRVSNRFLYIGSDLQASAGARLAAVATAGFESFEEIEGQIEYVRQSESDGWVLYDSSTLTSAGYWERLAGGPFALPAAVPFLWWLYLP